MSTIAEKRSENLDAAELLKKQLDNHLSIGLLDGDLVAVIVPIEFVVAVQANPGSSMTEVELKQLAEDNRLSFFES